jgi:preprotein translocase subunit SecD
VAGRVVASVAAAGFALLSGCAGTGSTPAATTPSQGPASSPQLRAANFAVRPVLAQREATTILCAHPVVRANARQPVGACSTDRHTFYRLGPAALTGSDIEEASVVIDPANGPTVELTCTAAGTSKLAEAAGAAFGKTGPAGELALVVDGVVLTAPQVEARISTGEISVVGGMSLAQAKSLAGELNAARAS